MNRPWPWGAIIASVAGIAILCTLGVWQVQRLAWKTALIAEIEARGKAPPISLAEALARAERGDDIAFVTLAAAGAFTNDPPLLMIGSLDGQPGWSVASPFLSDDGVLVLVDRGMVGDAGRTGAAPDAAPRRIAGQANWHAGSRNMFTPDNDPARNVWYWWDIPAMLGTLNVPANARVAPFVLHAAPDPTASTGPRPQPLTAHLRNNHLGYAITWFGLAAALAVIALVFVRRRMKT